MIDCKLWWKALLLTLQCGFRAGKGCVDVIYCVCQLVEKTIIYHSKIFLLFVDLCKAYGFVPT